MIYTADGGDPDINVRMEGEAVWLIQAQIVDLDEDSVVREFRITAMNNHYFGSFCFDFWF